MPVKHGGHNKGHLSPKAKGSGLVFEVRQAMQLTQAEFAKKLHCGLSTVTRSEHSGTLPRQKAVLANLKKLARQHGIKTDLP